MCPIEGNGEINGRFNIMLILYVIFTNYFAHCYEAVALSSSSQHVHSYVQGQQNKDWFVYIGVPVVCLSSQSLHRTHLAKEHSYKTS